MTVLSCDYTYKLYMYSNELPADQKTISFPMTLQKLSEHATAIPLPEFVQLYLSGKIGTPLLMLQDIFGTPGQKLIVGLPPELLKNPSPLGQPLSGVLDGWIEALGQTLESIEKAEAILQQQQDEEQRQEEYLRRLQQQEQNEQRNQQRVVLNQMSNKG